MLIKQDSFRTILPQYDVLRNIYIVLTLADNNRFLSRPKKIIKERNSSFMVGARYHNGGDYGGVYCPPPRPLRSHSVTRRVQADLTGNKRNCSRAYFFVLWDS
jgi:hypothetical protein